MPLPTVLGTYIAGIKSRKLDEYNGGPILDVLFQLRQFCDPQTGWTPVAGDLEITKRFFFKKSDGEWSDHTLSAFKDSLQWAGTLRGLVEEDWTQKEVQVVVGQNEKDGKKYIGVDFMNPRDYEGRHLESDPTVVQTLEAKYGALLKAKTGAKTNGTPKPSAAKQVLGQATSDPLKVAMSAAWKDFQGKTANLTTDERKASWLETVATYGGGKATATLTAAEWNIIGNKICEYGPYKKPEPEPTLETVPPDDESPALRDEDIPF